MMKQILLMIGALFIYSLSFSMTQAPGKKIILKGGNTLIPSSSVQVTLDKDKTLTTTFNKDMDNVTITIKKQSGEVISIENMDAKEWDICPTNIPDYKEGEYIIEISTPDGALEGQF